MIQELSSEKKELRFLSAFPEPFFRPLQGLNLLWPDLIYTEVVEISLGGLVAVKPPQFQLPKNKKLIEIKLQIPGLEMAQHYDVEVEKITENFIYVVFDIKDPKSRLLIESTQKDEVIARSLQEVPLNFFENSRLKSLWIHGAFETNFNFWFDEDKKIQHFALEYDNMFLFFKNGEVWTQRSSLSKNSGKSYFLFDEELNLKGPKMSFGNTWVSRLVRLLESAQKICELDLHPVIQILRQNRIQ